MYAYLDDSSFKANMQSSQKCVYKHRSEYHVAIYVAYQGFIHFCWGETFLGYSERMCVKQMVYSACLSAPCLDQALARL